MLLNMLVANLRHTNNNYLLYNWVTDTMVHYTHE